MAYRREFSTSDGVVHVAFTDRADGDFRAHGDPSRGAPGVGLVEHPRSWLRQVHGAQVIEVSAPGDGVGAEGDGLVTARRGAVLSVLGADCPLVALISPDGVVGVVHAGWRGLVAGVLPATVQAMARLGARDVTALLGPCICPDHYEFGATDLDRLAATLGPTVRARTHDGRPALDLRAGVEASLQPLGVRVDRAGWCCTAAGDGHFSHRARADTGRHAALVWLQPRSGAGRMDSMARAGDGSWVGGGSPDE